MRKEFKFRFFGKYRSLFCDCSLQVSALSVFQNHRVAFIAKPLAGEVLAGARIACLDEILGQFRLARLLDDVISDNRVWFCVCSSDIGADALIETCRNLNFRIIELVNDGIASTN